jgi:hypothetical protein
VTTKRAAADEPPTEFNWLSLAQPTTEPDPWEVDAKKQGDGGPFWVQDDAGNQFATYVLVKGLKPLDESPFGRSGELRSPIPGGIDTAPAD